MQSWWPAAGLLAALVASASSAAAFPSARLIYVRGQGAERCPEEIELRLAVAHRLGYDPFHTGSRRTIIAAVEREGDGFAGRFELVDERGISQGERRMPNTSEQCADVVSALSLSMSIAIDPERTEPAEAAPPSAARFSIAQPSAATADRAPAGASSAATSKKSAASVRLGLGGELVLGVAPVPVAGALVTAGVRYESYSLALDLRADAAGSQAVRADLSVKASLLAGSVAPCFHVEPAFVCALGTIGRLTASSNSARARSDAAWYGAAGGRLGTELAFSDSLGMRFHTELLGTFTRHRIDLDNQAVWRMPLLSGSLGVVLLASLP